MDFKNKVVELDVNDVLPNRFQPRIKFNEDSINELSESIKEHGVIQPIVVRTMGDKYEIIAGERRYKASLLAGKQTIPAIITDLNDKDSAEVALIENVQRKDLTPIEEAISYKKILDMGYLTQEELALKLGKNQSTVANKLRLLNLAEDVQEAVLEEKISERHARSLLKLQNQRQQIEMLNKIIEGRLTVRKTDEEIAKMLKPEPVVIEAEDVEFNPFNVEPLKEALNKEKGEFEMNENFDPFKIEEPVMTNDEVKEPSNFGLDTVQMEEPAVAPVNPGFMDVSQIEATAQDINTRRPEIDIDTLLKPLEQEQPTTIPEQEKVELPSSKFFNLPFDDEEDTFDPFMTSDKQEESHEEVQVNNEVQAEPVTENKDLFSFNFDDVFNSNYMQQASSTEVSEEMPTESVAQEEVSEVNMEPTIETSNFQTETPTMPDFDLGSVTSSEDMPIPTLIEKGNRNLTEALNVIRNCSKELERLGFITDVEEIDFESMYQVIFKIQK